MALKERHSRPAAIPWIDQARRATRQTDAMLAVHRAGKTDRQIAEFFGVSLKQVREWKRANGLMDNQQADSQEHRLNEVKDSH